MSIHKAPCSRAVLLDTFLSAYLKTPLFTETFVNNDPGEEDVTALQWLTVEGSNPVVNIEIGTQNFWHIKCLNASVYVFVCLYLCICMCVYISV